MELHPASESQGAHFHHPKYPGDWEAIPIEYKRGRPKRTNADKLQLCAEATCLEEAYGIHIPRGYLFYGETKHREEVDFDAELRTETRQMADEMHRLYKSGASIPPHDAARCRSCSLLDLCMPQMNNRERASDYLSRCHLLD